MADSGVDPAKILTDCTHCSWYTRLRTYAVLAGRTGSAAALAKLHDEHLDLDHFGEVLGLRAPRDGLAGGVAPPPQTA